MQAVNERWRTWFGIAFLPRLLAILGSGATAGTAMAEPFESYYLYNGAHPDNDSSPQFAPDFQGLAHDADNWFFTTTGDLWKIPVQYNLENVREDWAGVIHVSLSDTPIAPLGFWHIGDPHCHQGLLAVPIEAHGRPHALCFFRASDLQYVCHADVPDGLYPACDDPNGSSLGWVAIDPQGNFYVGGDCVTWLHKWYLNWGSVPTDPSPVPRSLPLFAISQEIGLVSETGAPLTLGHTQGAAFSEQGTRFYMLSGIYNNSYANEGISVFDTSTLPWRRVRQSLNGAMPFNYDFDPQWSQYEEPEGLDVWDLENDPRSLPARGRLHAGMYSNIWPHDLTLYHYTNRIHVDWRYQPPDPSDPEAMTGESHKPFNTVTAANNLAWDGSMLAIQSGTYLETLVFSRHMEISAVGGSVVIGSSP